MWRNPWTGLGDVYRWGRTVVRADSGSWPFPGLDADHLAARGGVLFGIAALVALWTVARRDDHAGLLLVAPALAIAFFALPDPRPRALPLPGLALAAALLRSWKWAALYGVLTLSFVNVYWLYTTGFSFAGGEHQEPRPVGQPMPRDPILASLLLTDRGSS